MNKELHEIDFLVAKAEGLPSARIENNRCLVNSHTIYSPTTKPEQEFFIREREKIDTFWIESKNQWVGANIDNIKGHGKTSLEASMRCYAKIKFG